MAIKGLFGLFKNVLWPFLWLVCELVCGSLWNVQKIIFKGCLDEEKNSDC